MPFTYSTLTPSILAQSRHLTHHNHPPSSTISSLPFSFSPITAFLFVVVFIVLSSNFSFFSHCVSLAHVFSLSYFLLFSHLRFQLLRCLFLTVFQVTSLALSVSLGLTFSNFFVDFLVRRVIVIAKK